ncbi:MAG: cysteine hydrolase [Thermoplasmata archaeon]|nr:cysteine hydrolase [Thermoplasmata archaeon]
MTGEEFRAKTDCLLRSVDPYRRGYRSERHPFTPDLSALLVIDMQRFFMDESSHAFVTDSPFVAENIRKLVESYRSRGLPVIFTRHALLDDEPPGIMGTWWSDNLRISDPQSEIVDGLLPLPDEKVVRKTRYSAFLGTDLEHLLRSKGIERLVITGVMTHLCCESTARDAFMRDFEVFFVIDGTASSDDDLHESSLRCLTDGFVIPVTTEEVLGCTRE